MPALDACFEQSLLFLECVLLIFTAHILIDSSWEVCSEQIILWAQLPIIMIMIMCTLDTCSKQIILGVQLLFVNFMIACTPDTCSEQIILWVHLPVMIMIMCTLDTCSKQTIFRVQLPFVMIILWVQLPFIMIMMPCTLDACSEQNILWAFCSRDWSVKMTFLFITGKTCMVSSCVWIVVNGDM